MRCFFFFSFFLFEFITYVLLSFIIIIFLFSSIIFRLKFHLFLLSTCAANERTDCSFVLLIYIRFFILLFFNSCHGSTGDSDTTDLIIYCTIRQRLQHEIRSFVRLLSLSVCVLELLTDLWRWVCTFLSCSFEVVSDCQSGAVVSAAATGKLKKRNVIRFSPVLFSVYVCGRIRVS